MRAKPSCTHTKLVPVSENLGVFFDGRRVLGMPHSHSLSTAPRIRPTMHQSKTGEYFEENGLCSIAFAPPKAHTENWPGYIPLLAPSIPAAQSHQPLLHLTLAKNSCRRLVSPKEDSPQLHSWVFSAEWVTWFTPEVKTGIYAKWAAKRQNWFWGKISQGMMGWKNRKNRGKSSLAV